MKPRVLVLGGTGFIGRHFVKYLVTNDLASHVRVVDKSPPQMCFFTPDIAKCFESVTFKQGNLCNPATVEKCFEPDEGQGQFEIVVNLAAETRYGQEDKVYEEKSLGITTRCGAEAAKRGVKLFIEVSTAQVYEANNKAASEGHKLKPWTELAKSKLLAEEKLKDIAGLNYVIVRPATVYGPGDTSGLMPRVICGAVYRHINRTMKFLWTPALRISTVHVSDVAAALWHLTTVPSLPKGEVFNLADKSDSDQGSINKILEELFGIKTGFQGAIISMMASKLNMRSIAEEANDRHMGPWAEMLKTAGITNSPLSPFIDKELLYDNPLRVVGTKIEGTGFKYSVPLVTKESLGEQLTVAIDQKLFPDIFKIPAGAGEASAKAKEAEDD